MAGETTAAGTGLSAHSDSLRAAAEAADQAMTRLGIDRADWVVVFATTHHFSAYRRMIEVICERTGAEKVVGCSGYGVLTENGEIEDGAGIAVLVVSSPHCRAFPFIERPLHGRPDDAALAIAEQVQPQLAQNSALVLLPDTYHLNPNLFLAALNEEMGEIPLVGGGASEDGSQGRTYQFFGTHVESNAVSGMLLTGTASMDVRMTQACRPQGEPLIVTGAERNIIYELGGRPAFEVFQEAAGEERMSDLRQAVSSVFVGIPMDLDQDEIERGQYLVRNIVGVDPDSGAIGITDEVRTGQILTFTLREPNGARADLVRMATDLTQNRPSASFGLYFNCMAHGPRGGSLRGAGGGCPDPAGGLGRGPRGRVLHRLGDRPHPGENPPPSIFRSAPARLGSGLTTGVGTLPEVEFVPAHDAIFAPQSKPGIKIRLYPVGIR
jgi:small ligand-binding sensory domain FIST